jgi:hypothetical protein
MNKDSEFQLALEALNHFAAAAAGDPMAIKRFTAGGESEEFNRAAFVGMIRRLARDPREETESTVSSLLSEIFYSGDREALSAVAEALNPTDGKMHPVDLAWKVVHGFVHHHRRLPTKGEVRKIMLKSKEGHFPKEGDNKGWARLWQDSGLLILPKKKAKRGPSRHGQDSKPKSRGKVA